LFMVDDPRCHRILFARKDRNGDLGRDFQLIFHHPFLVVYNAQVVL